MHGEFNREPGNALRGSGLSMLPPLVKLGGSMCEIEVIHGRIGRIRIRLHGTRAPLVRSTRNANRGPNDVLNY